MFREMIEKTKQRRVEDAERWKQIPRNLCQVCGNVGEDRRCIFVGCGYDLKEASDKLIELTNVEGYEDQPNLYGIQVCKGCRAMFMELLGDFIEKKGRLMRDNLDDDGIYEVSAEDIVKMRIR